MKIATAHELIASLQLTDDGFLVDREQWSEDIATAIALCHGIELEQQHWEILNALIDYCERQQEAPSMRGLVNEVKQTLGPTKGRSIYLMQLFGASPAKLTARIAGFPKPKNCL